MDVRYILANKFKWHVRMFSKIAKEKQYQRCYEILGLEEGCDQEQIRLAYLALVKRFHPDSGSKEASAEKFHEIENAFRLLTEKKSRERWNVEDDTIKEQDIKHTAPQHRQYLSFDGVGYGTPSQREKQYKQMKAIHAADNVMQHRLNKATNEQKALWDKSAAKYKHKIKTKYGLDRLVEDLIQESMSKGEFDNLPGSGKPLEKHENRNPYLDFTTHKLNEVLIENGFIPEWISLQKEIREEIDMLRDGLALERSYFGPYPLNESDGSLWQDVVQKYEKVVVQINKKIAKYNLVVPILTKQRFPINLQNESQKILINGKCSKETDYHHFIRRNRKEVQDSRENTLASLFSFIFKV